MASVLSHLIVIELRTWVKTQKIGDFLVITLPKKFVKKEKIKEGQILEITIKKVRKDGFGIFKGMRPFTIEDELTTHA